MAGKATNISAQVQSNPAAPGPAIHFYLADQIGSTQLELAAGGWPTSQALYTPFGQEIVNGGPILPGSGDGTAMRFKFTGKERDPESGLDYFGARYYGSTMGRFCRRTGRPKRSPFRMPSWTTRRASTCTPM